MNKATTTTRKLNYFRLPRPLWRKLNKYLPKKRENARRGGRPRASQIGPSSTAFGTCFGAAASGRPSTAIGSV